MGVACARFAARLATLVFLLQPGTPVPPRASQSQAAAIDAHPVGVPVHTIIEFGEQYLGSELYDAKITVLEVLRGEKARNIVQRASPFNPAPKSGFDYVLARVQFEFSARTSPANDTYNLSQNQFAATDADGREFSSASLVAYPQPPLSGNLRPGQSLEGWVVFLAPQKVSKPLMVFREDVGEVSHRGGGTWFQLYTRSGASPSTK